MSSSADSSKIVSGWQWSLMGLLFAGIIATSLVVTRQAHEVRQQSRDIGQLRMKQDQERAEWGRLLLEQSTWTAYKRVENLATTHLAMRIPEPGEVRMLPQ